MEDVFIKKHYDVGSTTNIKIKQDLRWVKNKSMSLVEQWSTVGLRRTIH